jgi:CRP/FNR family transcriptional regulator, polysaccharide utilization system transcription regulator
MNMLCIASEEVKEVLARFGKAIHMRAGTVLLAQGEPSPGIYLIINGTVSTRVSANHEPRVAEAGSLLGVPATINGTPYSISAVVAEDSTLIHVPKPQLIDLMRSNPAVSFAIIELLSTEVREIRTQLKKR